MVGKHITQQLSKQRFFILIKLDTIFTQYLYGDLLFQKISKKKDSKQSNVGCRLPCEISIYTLSDLGDLSNLTGSLSRTIQQYSPPSEWIMCELGVFPIFFENDLLKVDKILGLTFLKARKDFEGFKTAFFHLL